MKTMKKLFALLLALTMVFGLAATAFAEAGTTSAETGTGSITIDPTYVGQTYYIYRIFDLTFDPGADGEEGTADDAFSYRLRDWDKTEGKSPWGLLTGDDSFYAWHYDVDGDGTDEYVNQIISVDPNTGLVTWIAKKTVADEEVEDADENGKAVRNLAELARKYITRDTTGSAVLHVTEDKGPLVAESANDKDDANKGKPITVENLPLGYYFVSTATGSICSLDTTNKNAKIGDKNHANKQDKQQAEDDGTDYKDDDNTAAIGDKVKYQVTVTIQPGAKKLCLHDKMTDGLTFNAEDVVVKDAEGNALNVADSEHVDTGPDYTENSNQCQYGIWYATKDDDDMEDCADPHCTFHIIFFDEYLEALTAQAIKNNPTEPQATTLTVTYTATVNKDAVIYADETDEKFNGNQSRLTWGDDLQTVWDLVKTHVFEITVYKFTGEGENEMALAGAEFELYKNYSNGTLSDKVEFDMHTDGIGGNEEEFDDDNGSESDGGDFDPEQEENITPQLEVVEETPDLYTVCPGGDACKWKNTHTGIISTNSTGTFNIEGLDAKTYYLKEIKAPDGYNLLAYPIQVNIAENPEYDEDDPDSEPYVVVVKTTADGTKYEDVLTVDSTNGNKFGVKNNTGTELPSTGGMGTTLFYVVGGLLVLGAAVLLVTKKRTNT